jgi:signal transduction histidine kinase
MSAGKAHSSAAPMARRARLAFRICPVAAEFDPKKTAFVASAGREPKLGRQFAPRFMVITQPFDRSPEPRAMLSSKRRPASKAAQALVFFGVSTLIALGLSMQFLAQPFVWRNWPIFEVLQGWLYVFRDRLIVAALIAMAIVVLGVPRARVPVIRSALLTLAVLIGAVMGEYLVRLLYQQPENVGSLLVYALRWGAIAFAVATTYYLWRASVDNHEQLRQESLRSQSVEQQLTNTRLSALRRQIEPHFLFNTLATVRRLHQTDPAIGAEMLASFIDYLRRVPPMLDRAEVSLGEEINLIQAYLSVIKIRMAGRLAVNFQVPVELESARIPPLSLATLVENAVKHGLSPLADGGTLSVMARVDDDLLAVTVADDGVGLKADAGGGTGIGLYNVRSRLATLHGSRGSLSVQANMPKGVCATISLPLSREVA